MSHVFYRKYGTTLPTIVRGDGPYLYDREGKRYFDGSGGAMVCNVGQGVEEIADRIGIQAQKLVYVNGTAFTNEPVEALADLLVAKAPPGLDHAYFLSSGSEAVEAALKLARQYHVARGETSRSVIIAQTPGYHGNTLLALAASARAHYKTYFGPWLTGVEMIAAPYPYRGQLGDASLLEAAILKAGPENVAAFIAEPVGGSSTGASIAQPSYFADVRAICDKYGVLFICDEVLTGAGRTGRYFAIEHFSDAHGNPVVPDVITMGKGLNGGYAPLSAFLTKSSIVDTVVEKSGFMHAQTYSHNPLAAAAGLAVQEYIDEYDLVTRAARLGIDLGAGLSEMASEFAHPAAQIIGDVRGIGALWSVEFVRDRATKAPLPREMHFVETLVARAKDLGLVLWPNVGHADGHNGDLVMIAPAFTIVPEQVDELLGLLRESIVAAYDEVLASVSQPGKASA
jgi:adenosylmethionine-8-amino-7-oxononanoate aminotransferase